MAQENDSQRTSCSFPLVSAELHTFELFKERADARAQLLLELCIGIQHGSAESNDQQNPADGFLRCEREVGPSGSCLDGNLGEECILFFPRCLGGTGCSPLVMLLHCHFSDGAKGAFDGLSRFFIEVVAKPGWYHRPFFQQGLDDFRERQQVWHGQTPG
jgi:hypothetical protein